MKKNDSMELQLRSKAETMTSIAVQTLYETLTISGALAERTISKRELENKS